MDFDDDDLTPYEKRLIRGGRRRGATRDLYDRLIDGSVIGCLLAFLVLDLVVAIALLATAFAWWAS